MIPLKMSGCLVLLAVSLFAAGTLDVYIIDVEGGKSVLTVSPSGETMLVDVGWPRSSAREASTDRIMSALRAARVNRIDYLVISHFDGDHLGDVPQLISRVPVRHIVDHGEIQFSGAITDPRYLASVAAQRERFKAYSAVRDKIDHRVVNPGDRIPLKGAIIDVLAAGGKLITHPLQHAGQAGAECAANPQASVIERDVEDNLSIGLLLTFGKFRMLDLADLESHHSHNLVCPVNLIGKVDVYNVNVHGQFKGIAPELINALHARVAIMANGERKGADPETWPILRAAPGLEDIWQAHYSAAGGGSANPAADFIANLTESADTGSLIKISAGKDGSFTVLNTRNGFTKSYPKRN